MAWFDTDWDHRISITVQSSKVDADLTDYPVYVDLSDLPAAFFSGVKSDGADIRVTKSDETTQVPCEVVTIDTGASTGEIHFQADGTLSSSSNTVFYIYYGNASATMPADNSTYGAENVWDSNFENVYHMQEDPSGTAPQVNDSTSNGRDGTTFGSMASGDLVAVKLEDGYDFDGSGDRFHVASFGMSSGSSVTVEAWVNIDSTTGRAIVDESNNSSYGGGLHCRFNSSKLMFWSQDANDLLQSTSTFSTSTDYYVSAVYDGTDNIIYIDGSQDSTNTPNGFSTRSAANPRVASSSLLGSGFYMDGRMDEVRVSSTGRSADWISTTYNNQNSPSTFYSTGTEEDAPVTAEDPAIFFGCAF